MFIITKEKKEMNERKEDFFREEDFFNKAEFFGKIDSKKFLYDLNSVEPYIKRKKRMDIFGCIVFIFVLIAYIEKKLFQEYLNIGGMDLLKGFLGVMCIIAFIVILFLDYLKLKPLKKLKEDLKRDIEEDKPKTIQIKITNIGAGGFFANKYDKNKPSASIYSIKTTDGRIFYCNALTQYLPIISYKFMAEITYYENSRVIKSARIL